MPIDIARAMEIQAQIPKTILVVLNQLFQIEQKLGKRPDDSQGLRRNLGKIKDALAEEGLPVLQSGGKQVNVRLNFEDPIGQTFSETRTDLDATIAGTGTDNLVVVEVIKPIIRATVKGGEAGFSRIVQKGIVIVESRKER